MFLGLLTACSTPEADGDCDDDDDNSHPDAEERADAKDNNCNGIADEGTLLYDDDGDGYSEANTDCNDDDPAMYPGAFDGDQPRVARPVRTVLDSKAGPRRGDMTGNGPDEVDAPSACDAARSLSNDPALGYPLRMIGLLAHRVPRRSCAGSAMMFVLGCVEPEPCPSGSTRRRSLLRRDNGGSRSGRR